MASQESTKTRPGDVPTLNVAMYGFESEGEYSRVQVYLKVHGGVAAGGSKYSTLSFTGKVTRSNWSPSIDCSNENWSPSVDCSNENWSPSIEEVFQYFLHLGITFIYKILDYFIQLGFILTWWAQSTLTPTSSSRTYKIRDALVLGS